MSDDSPQPPVRLRGFGPQSVAELTGNQTRTQPFHRDSANELG
jgi:hypothetical protein